MYWREWYIETPRHALHRPRRVQCRDLHEDGDDGNPAGMEANVTGFPWGWKQMSRESRGMEKICGTPAELYSSIWLYVVPRFMALTQDCMKTLDCNIWRSSITTATKNRLYSAYILPVLLYGAETWTLTKVVSKKIDSSTYGVSVAFCVSTTVIILTVLCQKALKRHFLPFSLFYGLW